MIATLTRMRAGLLVGTLVLGACLLLAGAARAAETLDQQQAVEDPNGYWASIQAGFSEGQTFTAGMSGSLTRVSLMLGKLNEDGSLGNLTVKIYATSGGLPAGSPLAASTISPDEVGPSDTAAGSGRTRASRHPQR